MEAYQLFAGKLDFVRMLWGDDYNEEESAKLETQLSWSPRPITKMGTDLRSVPSTQTTSLPSTETANYPVTCSPSSYSSSIASFTGYASSSSGSGYASGGGSASLSPENTNYTGRCMVDWVKSSPPSQELKPWGRRRNVSTSSGGSGDSQTPGIFCPFCKKNGETKEFYTTHKVKDPHGRVICPVLRAYSCPLCGATGDRAHTESHCPFATNQRNSVINSLRTRRTSCGARRVGYNNRF